MQLKSCPLFVASLNLQKKVVPFSCKSQLAEKVATFFSKSPLAKKNCPLFFASLNFQKKVAHRLAVTYVMSGFTLRP